MTRAPRWFQAARRVRGMDTGGPCALRSVHEPDALPMSKPLSGVRVLDLTNVLAGPFCCHQLAHMGADVIKVETPGSGDLARQLGADAELNRKLMGVSFLAQNPGKRSITINL